MFLQKVLISMALFAAGRSLRIEDSRPGAIPQLTNEVTNMDGGWSEVDKSEFDQLIDEMNHKIKGLEAIDAIPGSPRHKAIKVKRAITRVVAGSNKKVVFTVGQLNNSPPLDHINPNGQYGECYFKLFFPLGNNPSTLTEHRCVKITKQEANFARVRKIAGI